MKKFIFTPRLFVIIAAISLGAFLPTQNAQSSDPDGPCPNTYCSWASDSCTTYYKEDTICKEAFWDPTQCMGNIECPEPH